MDTARSHADQEFGGVRGIGLGFTVMRAKSGKLDHNSLD